MKCVRVCVVLWGVLRERTCVVACVRASVWSCVYVCARAGVSADLHDGSEEGLRREEPAEPRALGQPQFTRPDVQLPALPRGGGGGGGGGGEKGRQGLRLMGAQRY